MSVSDGDHQPGVKKKKKKGLFSDGSAISVAFSVAFSQTCHVLIRMVQVALFKGPFDNHGTVLANVLSLLRRGR